MSRPAWKGFLRISLVSVPVEAYTTLVTGAGEVHLNQLHRKCHSRIRYKKVCPIHGEVSNDDILMGYEYSKDNYVEVDERERKRLRTKSDKSIDIDTFVPVGAIDPIYFKGQNYYLMPDGTAGEKPYALFYQVMHDEERCAVAQVAMSGRDEVVTVTAKDGLLIVSLLYFAAQIKSVQEFKAELTAGKPRADEVKLAKTLVHEAFNSKLDLSSYHNTFTEKLREVIDAKVAGNEIVTPPDEETPHVINLMDALRKSVFQSKSSKKPAKKMAKSTRHLTLTKRKRKSS
jgi:DNA end-binding protein Ku